MEAAAEVGDSWVFTRLSEELTRSRWSGQPPWDALHALADELGLPELDDFADIMRLSGEEGCQRLHHLRARSAAMRTAMLNDEIAEANAVGERDDHPRLPARRRLHGAARRAIAASDVQQHLTAARTKGTIDEEGTPDEPMLGLLLIALARSIAPAASREQSGAQSRSSMCSGRWPSSPSSAIVVAAMKAYVTAQAGNIK